jgi:hypothetical protein
MCTEWKKQNEVWVFKGSLEQVVKALLVSMVLGHLLSAGFLLGLFLNLEDVGDMFLQNVG